MKATVLAHLSRQCLLCSCELSEVKDRLRRFIGEVLHDFALYGRRIAAGKGSVVFIRLQR